MAKTLINTPSVARETNALLPKIPKRLPTLLKLKQILGNLIFFVGI
jgi:hypothetical protein